MEERNKEKATISDMGIKIKELGKGEMFGINALLLKKGKRSASIFANINCNLIILSKRDYMQNLIIFNPEKKEKLKFIMEKIPFMTEIASYKILDDYFDIFNNEQYLKKYVLTKEGDSGMKIYFIAEGFCIINKVIEVETYKNSQKVMSIFNIAIGKCGPGTIVGGELIFEKSRKYKYTITVCYFFKKFKCS